MMTLKQYALSFVGQPYLWGGDDPINGFDCSGLVQEILASVGLAPPVDMTAQGLYNHFEPTSASNCSGLGAIVFYGKSVTQITHVAFCIDQYRAVGANGGGSKSVDRASAAKMNAFVKLRLIDYRADRVAILKPRYATIGEFFPK